MPGGSKQQTTQTSSAPWGPAQPALTTAIKGAEDLYKSGVGGQVYDKSTVIPWDKQTVQGMNSITQGANANIGGAGLSGQYQDVINNGGLSDAQLGALKNTQSIANSKFDINANPAFQDVLRQSQDAATNSVQNAASASGRYGSGANQQLLGSTIGDLTSRMVGQEYNNWQNRRDAANSNVFNMGQTGFGNLGQAYTGMQAPANSLMQVGAMNEDLATRQMNDKLRIFNEQQNKPWDQLGRLNAIASGAGSMGGTQTQSQPGQNPFLTAMGYGLGGAGLFGSFL
jgi:hypothetical protein